MNEFNTSKYIKKLDNEMTRYLVKDQLIATSIYQSDSRIINGETEIHSNNLINARLANNPNTIAKANISVNNFNEDILKFTSSENKKRQRI